MRSAISVVAIAIAIFLSSLMDVCRAADPPVTSGELVEKGNRLLGEGFYGQALTAYDKALEKSPGRAEVAYNRGIALYRLGRFQEAETAFQDSLSTTQPELEGKAKYNLGRCAHAMALNEHKDLEGAINKLTRAIGFYRDALQLRPDDADARHNTAMAEHVRSYLKKKLELLKKQKKKSTSQPSDKNQSDDSKKDQDSQKQKGDQKDGKQDPDSQKGEDQDQQGKKKDAQSDPSTQPGEQQEAASQPSREPKPEQDPQPATQPSEEVTTQPMSAQSQPTSQPEDQISAMRRISIEQAMQMLQEARDAEQKRREMKLRMKMRQQGRTGVEKDW